MRFFYVVLEEGGTFWCGFLHSFSHVSVDFLQEARYFHLWPGNTEAYHVVIARSFPVL